MAASNFSFLNLAKTVIFIQNSFHSSIKSYLSPTQIYTPIVSIQRYKSKKSKSETKDQSYDESDSDSDNEDFGSIAGKGTEIKSIVVSSMRLDLLLKSGLGIARNKIEEAFYESRLRVNSKKVFKKSNQVRVGDEIDLIKGVSPSNSSFIIVGRVEILSAKPRETEDIQVKMRRSKALVIDNYPDGDPWKQSAV